jgi:hypothetical protein
MAAAHSAQQYCTIRGGWLLVTLSSRKKHHETLWAQNWFSAKGRKRFVDTAL